MARTSAGRRATPIDALVSGVLGDLSERELAKQTGVCRAVWTGMRQGSAPRFATVERLATRLGLPAAVVAEAVAETVRLAREACR